MKRPLLLLSLLLLCVGGGSLIGLSFTPDGWYDGLAKPDFNPPDWLFGPVWTLLYIFIAVAGWRVWSAGGDHAAAKRAWIAQLLFNFAWSPVFFGMHQIGAALLVALAMLASIIAFVVVSWRAERSAALLFLPYGAWVAFAAVLNAAILSLN
ncbi:MAG: TspO/MBR family protein [Rhizobiaceae bacterium]